MSGKRRKVMEEFCETSAWGLCFWGAGTTPRRFYAGGHWIVKGKASSWCWPVGSVTCVLYHGGVEVNSSLEAELWSCLSCWPCKRAM